DVVRLRHARLLRRRSRRAHVSPLPVALRMTVEISRRAFIERGASLALVPLLPHHSTAPRTVAGQPGGYRSSRGQSVLAPITALVPRDASGHQFAMYSDATSGRPDAPNVAVFSRLNGVMNRLTPPPEFIAFPGDAVGNGSNAPEWDHFLNVEMQ